MHIGADSLRKTHLVLSADIVAWLDRGAEETTLGRSGFARTVLRERMRQEREKPPAEKEEGARR